MKRIASIMAAVALVCFAAGLAMTQDEAKKEEKKAFKYTDMKQCVMCHAKLDDASKKYEESKHAKAFEALATDEAKKFSKDPQNDPACLECHVTGYGKDGGWAADLDEKTKAKKVNVTCESCHGPGSGYNAYMMKAKKDGYSAEAAAEAGLVQKPGKEVCLTCHNEKSPTYKEFDYEKALEQIRHGEKLTEKGKE